MTTQASPEALREEVRARYAAAARAAQAGQRASDEPAEDSAGRSGPAADGAGCCGPAPADRADGPVDASCGAGSCCDGTVDAALAAAGYDPAEQHELPEAAVLASLGCGNPVAVADLRPGERVLDLGSGGGIDVLLSAKRVGPTGRAYGLDMTDEMLDLARHNAARAGATNVEFIKGTIEDIPLPDGSIDVIISNCVINLSVDKPAVFAEMARVLRPGGRIGIADVLADDGLSPAERAERGSYVGCIAGALSAAEYRAELAAAGFGEVSITPTHQVTDGMQSCIVRASRLPAALPRA